MLVHPFVYAVPQLSLAAEDIWQSSQSFPCKPCMAERLHAHHCYLPRDLYLQLAHQSLGALLENAMFCHSPHTDDLEGCSSVVVVYQSHLKQSTTLSVKATAVLP